MSNWSNHGWSEINRQRELVIVWSRSTVRIGACIIIEETDSSADVGITGSRALYRPGYHIKIYDNSGVIISLLRSRRSEVTYSTAYIALSTDVCAAVAWSEWRIYSDPSAELSAAWLNITYRTACIASGSIYIWFRVKIHDNSCIDVCISSVVVNNIVRIIVVTISSSAKNAYRSSDISCAPYIYNKSVGRSLISRFNCNRIRNTCTYDTNSAANRFAARSVYRKTRCSSITIKQDLPSGTCAFDINIAANASYNRSCSGNAGIRSYDSRYYSIILEVLKSAYWTSYKISTCNLSSIKNWLNRTVMTICLSAYCAADKI